MAHHPFYYTMTKVPYCVYPLFAVVASTAVGMTLFLVHEVKHPMVVWNKKANPEPFRSIAENETTHLYDPTGTHKKWKRNAL